MKVLMVEPGKTAYELEIGDSLKDIQQAVDGNIEVVYPYDEPVAIVCNEEGKNKGFPLNRALYNEQGEIYDIVAGKFFVCGLSEENFASLSQEHMEQFKERFYDPEVFIKINGQINAKKVTEQKQTNKNQKER